MDENDFKRLLDASAAQTQRLIEASAAETQRRIEASATALQRQVDETNNRIDANAVETQRRFDQTTEQLRLHFDVALEGMRNDVKLVAEKVILLDEKVDREAADIRAEMRQGFADMQAVFKFSHSDLDRRLRALE